MNGQQQHAVVTGANGRIGQNLLPRLQAKGYHVTALVRKPAVLNGADRVIPDWMAASDAHQAIAEADLVIALSGELFASDSIIREAIVSTTQIIVNSLKKGRARRLITISYLAASTTERNAYLRANGEREQMLKDTGIETVVFRCPAILNTPQTPDGTSEAYTAKSGKVQVLGNGRQRQRPVYRGDVINAIMNALEMGKPGIYDLVGPDDMSADEMITLINRGKPVTISHFAAPLARLFGRFIPGLTPTVIDVVLRDSTADPTRVTREFDLKLTSLRTVWTDAAKN